MSPMHLLFLLAACAATGPTLAQPADPAARIGFSLRPAAAPDRFRLSLSADRSRLSSDYAAAALVGLDRARLAQGGAPIGFALVAQPGRLDCAGASDANAARGDCRYTADRAFGTFLAGHGIHLRDDRQSLELALTGVTRDLVQALTDAHYPAPTPDALAGMAALGVTRVYIADLAAHGYRPNRADTLLAFRAIGVTGDYIRGLADSGYRALSADEIVQFRALGVSPAFLGELAAAGYPALSADDVVRLRALNVTRGTIEELNRDGRHLPVNRLVALGVLRTSPQAPPAPARPRQDDRQ